MSFIYFLVSNQQCPSSSNFVCGIPGKPGQHGSNGAPGRDGRDGRDGAKGDQGLQGKTGPQGPRGNKGLSGAEGPAGAKGDRGPRGPPGPKGSSELMPSKNWKECVWRNLNDGKDNGLVKVICVLRTFNKRTIFIFKQI